MVVEDEVAVRRLIQGVLENAGYTELCRERPDLRVLYMSGYAEGEVFRHGVETRGERFLAKPFTPAELRDRVAAILAGEG